MSTHNLAIPTNHLTDIFKLFPNNLLDKNTSKKLTQLTNDLDHLCFLDGAGELSADRDAFIRIVKESAFIPPDLHEITILETAKHLGRRLKRKGVGLPLTWSEAAKYGTFMTPLSSAEQRALVPNKAGTEEELRTLLSKNYAAIDKVWFEPANQKLTNDVLRNFAHNRTVWDCVVAHIGIWGAIGVFAAVGGAIIVLTATGGAAAPLVAWLIAVLGGSTATIVLNCILNPG
jgi:hypothetical protein